jgi:hypothetical protein
LAAMRQAKGEEEEEKKLVPANTLNVHFETMMRMVILENFRGETFLFLLSPSPPTLSVIRA